MRRTQIYLDDDLYLHLKEESRSLGRTVSDVIRSRLRQGLGRKTENILGAVDGAFGLWRDRDFDVDQYVRDLRKDRDHGIG